MKPTFIKQHKKNLKKLTRKQLIQQIINHIEITTQMENQFNEAYEKLDEEKQICESELIRTEKIYKNISIFQFIKNKYVK